MISEYNSAPLIWILETLYFQLGEIIEQTPLELNLSQTIVYFYVGADLIDIIPLADRSYTVQYKISDQVSDLPLKIYACGMNKVNQKTYARLQSKLLDFIGAARSKRTFTLSLNQNGETESLEDCLKNKSGLQINTICTADSHIALNALP